MTEEKFQFGKLRAILMLLVLVVITMGATTLLSREVTLILEDEKFNYETTATTVEGFMVEKGVKFEDNMIVTPALDTAITNKMEIEIKYPRDIVVVDNGVEETISSAHILVESILDNEGIELGEKDYSVPALDEEVSFVEGEETVIKINRVTEKVVSDVVTVAYTSIINENPNMLKGQTKVVQEGSNGASIVKSEVTYLNNEEVKAKVVEEKVVVLPLEEIKEVGTKEPAKVVSEENVAGSGLMKGGKKVVKIIRMQATAYDASAESNGQWAGITALGTKLRPGVVAVDRSVIPLRTQLYVESADGYPSYGMAVAEDVGGAIKGKRIDLFFESKTDVYNFGRRDVIVYVLEP